MNHQLAMNRALRDIDTEQEINELVNSGLNDWQEVSAPILNPVLDLVHSTSSFEEFSARLPELTNQMDSQVFIEQLTRLCWQARALGDVTDG
ncbi:hypothetical protein [Photobacterium arenosum]|uniref:hypothetical protein n=1 Tax=Photobacterium arenosum TaxID=2774143 RepID=UPI004057FABB